MLNDVLIFLPNLSLGVLINLVLIKKKCIGGHNIGLRSQNDGPLAKIGVFWLDLGHFA